MNILVFLVAGVTVGWVANRLYHSFADDGQVSNDDIVATETAVKDPKKAKLKKTAKAAKKQKVSNDTTDDLSQLKGVGPKLADALDEIGIYNYKQLSSSSADELLVRLRETGGRFSMASISSIVERAKLAIA